MHTIYIVLYTMLNMIYNYITYDICIIHIKFPWRSRAAAPAVLAL